jgi:diacylglycerol kinase family enzyme
VVNADCDSGVAATARVYSDRVASALIVNPNATRVTPELTVAVERELRAAGDQVETYLTERPRHAVELAAEAARGSERLYVFGGDGAFNEVVNGLEEDVVVGFLPGGSTSVLTRALGLPRDPVEAARILARTDRERRVSLGRVNGRRFTFGAGVGLDAELVRRVDGLGRRDGRRPGDVAFIRALAGMLVRKRGRLPPAMTVLGRDRVAFALVANCDPYSFAGPIAVHAAPQARFEGGLDLVAPRAVAPWQLPRVASWAVTGRGQVSSPRVVYLHDVDAVEVECDAPTPLQADGEDLGDVVSARFEAERDALRVLVGDN